MTEESRQGGMVRLWLDAVIMTVTSGRPRVLTVARRLDGRVPRSSDDPRVDGLPFGPLDVAADRTLELGLRRWVHQQTGIQLGYVEQLYTFGDRLRDPREAAGGPRVVSAAYLALVRDEKQPTRGAAWRDVYGLLPWEDWRDGRPEVIDERIEPALERWVSGPEQRPARSERRARADIAYGLGGSDWDDERVLARYELLYEIGMVAEEQHDRAARAGAPLAEPVDGLGRPMALDHRRILATALGRLRGKIKYRPVVFELLPPEFTISQLRHTVESLAGLHLHAGNFRRLVEQGGLVEGTGRVERATGGRPAELFRFRREVMRERRAPGVGLPGAPRGSD